jgi:exodeoxyribonuclease V gamma subunit
MHGLKVFTSNRMELLAEQLAQTVAQPLSSPLSQEIIVVQSRGMERWLSMELAKHNRICANCAFPFPNRFLQEVFKKVMPDLPEESPFDPFTMTFRIMAVLPTCVHLPGFESLKNYLFDDTTGMKLFQISEKTADLFDQYLVFRPDLIFKWENGREEHWQAQLWRKLSSGKEKMHRASLRKALMEKIKKSHHEIDNFPSRVSIFGISYLPPFHLEAFIEISRIIQVNLFLMNPCKAYWADIVSHGEIKTLRKKYTESKNIINELYLEKGNRLLASLGTLGRNFFSMITGLDCQVYEHFKDPKENTILSKVQSDILHLKDVEEPVVSGLDTSIQIHSCHSPMREIEVLYDNLLAMFDKEKDLLPKDIAVMTPDIELYSPYIHAVFDAQTDEALRIPFTIADQNVRKESRVIAGFMSILELKDSRLGVTRVMELLELTGIKERFGLTDSEVEIAERWIKETHIRWGVDAEFRRKLGLPDFSQNTWKAGIERLLLGYAMPGNDRKMFSGILPYDHIEGRDVETLGKLLNFLNRIFSCKESLEHARTLSEWHAFLAEIIEQFFAPDENSEQEVQVLRGILEHLRKQEHLSGYDTPVEIDVVRSCLGHLLEHEHFGTGFISSGVTFCAMLPMRSIPFQVICLLGMNSNAFPRESKPLSFDLMAKKPRVGDRSRRSDDKYIFLEALLSARAKFYISYVGQSIQDNTRIPPSVLVSELIDYLKDGFGISEEEVVMFHRLQAFSSDYFKAGGRLFSYSRDNFIVPPCTFERKDISPLISEELPELGQEWKALDIDTLGGFFGNPAKFLLEKRLGVYLYETAPVTHERENFRLDNLEKYHIGQDLVENRLSGSDLEECLALQKAMGKLPHGNVGEVVFNEMVVDAKTFAEKIKKYIKGIPLDPLDADLHIDGFKLFGRLSAIHEAGQIQIRYAKAKSKYLINTWIFHLILCELDKEICSNKKSYLICKDAVWEFAPVADARDILRYLLQLYWKGLSMPLNFFPESSYEYARRVLLKKQTEQTALTFAQKKWLGSDFARGESQDPYFERCFGHADPLNEDFTKKSAQIFAPLLAHCTEIML